MANMEHTFNSQQQDLFAHNSEEFPVNLLRILSQDCHENIIFSPFAIQSCLSLARIGATGETAQEIDQNVGLICSNVTTMAELFNYLLKEYKNSNYVVLANSIYVSKGYQLRQEFERISQGKLLAPAETIDFEDSETAANKMNEWVAVITNGHITNLVSSSTFTNDTAMVLLNAIYFKAQWLYKFKEEDTRDEDFYVNDSDSKKIPMMSIQASFLYATLPELDAIALEMPYQNTGVSMLVILPNKRTGLQHLQDKLKHFPLSAISEAMYESKVSVKLPKFKAEFSIELNDPLKKLGIHHLFSESAELGNMLEDEGASVKVSKIVHKAFVEVNEDGTEAAAASALHVRKKRSLNTVTEAKTFIADHPFVYVVHHTPQSLSVSSKAAFKKVILFAGAMNTHQLFPLSSLQHDEL